MTKPNIIFYFPDQQRWDTVGAYGQKLDITPNLDQLAKEGVLYENAFTAQPVCGPCRSIFQTGKYPTETGCFRNNVALPQDIKTLADYFNELDYETGYIGKWHLASDGELEKKPTIDYTITAIPPERRGGYKGFWRASDVLEFTSHGYDGYVFDENMEKHEFKGYRVDCITDFALEFLDDYNNDKPFFMTISHIEPHHQNDREHYEGPDGSKERFKDFELPEDLKALGGGDAVEEYPDYLGCCKSLDDNLGRLIDKLKEKGIYENTIIIYSSDHGSHFKTRNREELNGFDDYKRSIHSSSLRVPLIIAGPGFKGGKVVKDLVSTASLPKTFLSMAGLDVGKDMIGEDLKLVADGKVEGRTNEIYAQISESRVGRCVRSDKYLYSVCAPGKHGGEYADSDVYKEEFLYDLEKDPFELDNLIKSEEYKDVRSEMKERLIKQMVLAGEAVPEIKEA